MKKMVWATVAYVVVTMSIAAPWHFVFFKELYHSLGIYNRAEPIVPLGLFSMILQGAILASVYPRYHQRGSHYQAAFRFSFLMGLFLFSVSTIANAAKIEVTPMATWLILQAAFHGAQFTAYGAALGYVYSRK